MAIAWHPKRWWEIFMSEYEKKEIESIALSNVFNVYNLRIF